MTDTIKDMNGNDLHDGDDVIISKDLSLKGAKKIKKGTVIKNISIYDEENIQGTIKGTGVMYIKREFVKKKAV